MSQHVERRADKQSYTSFKSDLIYIFDTEPSSVILRQTKGFEQMESYPQNKLKPNNMV